VSSLSLHDALPIYGEPSETPGDGLGAGQVVGEGVVVEEELADLREHLGGQGHLLGHVLGSARALALAAHRLGPEAECALRAAAPPGVERDVGMAERAARAVAPPQIAHCDPGVDR